ncbi:MAG: 2TM domain-containing protein [Actinomycetales bacterium]|nr:2TM domain-containing protein [Actinomycetales bacterium]
MSQQPQIPQPPQDAARLEAIEALTARMHFRRHLMTYVFVNIILWVIWLLAPGARGGLELPVATLVDAGLGVRRAHAVAASQRERHHGSPNRSRNAQTRHRVTPRPNPGQRRTPPVAFRAN